MPHTICTFLLALQNAHLFIYDSFVPHNFRAACVVNRTTAAINCESPLFFLALIVACIFEQIFAPRRHLVRHFNQRIVKKKKPSAVKCN
jgi:hypothetical protein